MAMTRETDFCLRPIRVVRSALTERSCAPRQGAEGAPDAWIELVPEVAAGLEGLAVNAEIVVVTWLHQGRRDILKVHPRGNNNVLSVVLPLARLSARIPLGCIASTCWKFQDQPLMWGRWRR